MDRNREVFRFSKSLLERMAEIANILDNGKVPAANVRNEWVNFLEVAIEPAGWQTIWRISRPLCETLKLRYPVIVMGTVQQVFHDELSALLLIENVEDDGQDDLQLPDQYEVPLIELWPLINQENSALNIDLTADAIDQLRFFYTKIWRPWDIDLDHDDIDWATKYLEIRLNFYFELCSKKISPGLTMHIKTILEEANYLHKHKEILESEMEDTEELDDVEKSSVKELMRVHLRLKMLQNEIELLENPDMRNNFEQIKFDEPNTKCQSIKRISLGGSSFDSTNNQKCDTFIVLNEHTLTESINYLQSINNENEKDKFVQIRHSLQNVLEHNSNIDRIFLSPGIHYVSFSEYLMGNCKISGPNKKNLLHEEKINPNEMAILKSKDYDNILLIVDSVKDFTLENIYFDSYNVRIALVAKSGKITLKNCVFEGDPTSSIREAILVYGNASIVMENCKIKNFATGIRACSKSSVNIVGSTIENCIVGIDVQADASICIENSKLQNNKQYGILITTENVNQKTIIFDEHDMNKLTDLKITELHLEKDVSFDNNQKGIISIFRAQNYYTDFEESMNITIDSHDDNVMEHENSKNDFNDSSGVILINDSIE